MMQRNDSAINPTNASLLNDPEYLDHVESALSAFNDLDQYESPDELPSDIEELEAELVMLEDAHLGAALDLRVAIEKVILCAGKHDRVYEAIAAIKTNNNNQNRGRLAVAIEDASGSRMQLRNDAIEDLVVIGMPEKIPGSRRKVKTFNDVGRAFFRPFELHHWPWLDDSRNESEHAKRAASIQEKLDNAKQAIEKAA